MIKALIFDLNGIFIQGPNLSESEKSKREFRMPVQEFMCRLKKEEKVSEKMVALAKEIRAKGISFETGFKKPDVRAWESILSENNLKPEECIYFDDQEKHIKACQSFGIKSFLFTNEKDLQAKFKELGI